MGKLILFKINSGDFATGFEVALQICEDNPEGITHPFTTITGKLPPCIPITQHYQQWQQSYRSLHQKVRLSSSSRQITHITNNCQNQANKLKDTLGNWYHCEIDSFAKIREKLLTELDTQDSIRLLIQTEITELRFLPWHLFFDSFLNQYLNAELAIAPVQYASLKPLPKKDSSIKILAVFGSSEGIDLTPDEAILSKLTNAEIVSLFSPTRQQLFNHLYDQQWDLLFFAGHSGKSEQTWQGKLHINSTDTITIDELNHALRQAINKGLRLALFNSCDGLGLAQDLSTLHLSQIIVMREMIPDKIAHVFVKEFLQTFSQNQPLYLAVRHAREKLQPFEKDFPCATWLPIICQNPATLPLTWQNLQGFSFNLPQLSESKTPDNLATNVLTKTINNSLFTVEYSDLTQIKAEVLVNSDDTYLSMSSNLAAELIEKGGKVIKEEVQRRIPKRLGQIAITTAGDLDADYIFHAVVLDYEQPELTSIKLIREVTKRCLDLAEAQGMKTIAFPALGTQIANFNTESSAIAMMVEIVDYLENNSHFDEVKIILYRSGFESIQDEALTRFYQKLSQFLELNHEFQIRSSLLTELQQIYQHHHLDLACQIVNQYQQQLCKLQQDWINKFLPENSATEFNPTSEYEKGLAEITEKVSHLEVQNSSPKATTETIIPQGYHELAARVWHDLQTISSSEEMQTLLSPLCNDVDGLAWLNDQYDMAIASHQAKLKKISEILQGQINELKQEKAFLYKQLLSWYQEGMLSKQSQGKERNLSFKSYPKLHLKVNTQDLPSDYRNEKVSYTPDKKALREAQKNGLDISQWAEIDANLKIKFGFR